MLNRYSDTYPTKIKNLKDALVSKRSEVVKHKVFQRIRTINHLRVFMEHHVFAVWDFMCLLKALQRELTCVDGVWLPKGNRWSRRLINEIVLGEESDEHPKGGFTSHYELYREAMDQCDANTSVIDSFVRLISQNQPMDQALQLSHAPIAAADFVKATWEIINSRSLAAIGAAFTFGREELVPDMFRKIVANLAEQFPGKADLFRSYLERHIHLDEEKHTPLAHQMLFLICNDDSKRWAEAEHGALSALDARKRLWDGILSEIS